jgi:hypothetical protein
VLALTRGGGDAFPNEVENRLLSIIPAGIRDSCTRARDVPSNALSAVDCSAERQQVSYYRFADRAQLRREHVRRARAQLPPNLRSDAGACGGPPRIGERSYLTSGRRVGRVFCGRSPGTSVIGWTDERTNVFARASRSGDDQVALYRWWATAAGPLRSTNRDSPEPPRTSVVPAGAVLYREGFSSRTSGWARPETEDARYGYSRGRYRIVVKQPNSVIPVTTANADPPLVFGSVRVEATVVRARGQRSYGFGLVCRRSQGGALYTLQVRSDSLALIRKRRAAGRPVELARPATLPRGALKRGPNRIAAVCAGGDGQPARLSLFLNGRRVVAAEDPRPLAATGAVGVLASSLSRGGVDVMFDDFRVRKA